MYVYVFACLTLLVCVCVCVCLVSHRNLICTQIAINLFVYYSLLPISLSLLTFLIFAIIIRIFAQPFKQFLPNIPNTFRTHTQQICLSTDYTVYNFYAQLLLLLFFLLFIYIQYFFGIYCIYLHIYQFSSLDYILVKFKTMCRQLVYQQSVCMCVFTYVCVCVRV